MDKICELAIDYEPFNLDLIDAAFALVDNVEITDAENGFQVHLIDLFLNNLDDFLSIQKRFQDSDNYHSILDLIEESK
jgi:hypothetical protein